MAQTSCASFEYLQEQLRVDPSLATKMQAAANAPKKYAQGEPLSGARGNVTEPAMITIPVVVHILYNSSEQNISDAQVQSQIEALNREFQRLHADTALTPLVFRAIAGRCPFRFVLASIDPSGYATSGIVRRQTSIQYFGLDDRIKSSNGGGDDGWDADKYLNIWVGNMAGAIIGYSSVLGGPKQKDGVVIRYTAFGTQGKVSAPYNRGRTTVHEIGHWLGLRHIWGDMYCGDDLIDDTPPQRSSTFGCPTTSVVTCNNGPNGNMYMNYMDLTYDACTNMFTVNQCAEMMSVFAEGGPRHALLFSNGASGIPLPAPVDPPADTHPVYRVYPNPARDEVVVQVGDEWAGELIFVYNNVGQVVMQANANGATVTLQIAHLREGVYFIRPGRSKKAYKFIHTAGGF